MKAFEEALRKILVVFGYILGGMFAAFTLLLAWCTLDEVLNGSDSWRFFLFGTAFCGLIAWLAFRSAQKHRNRDTWTDKLRAKSERNTKVMLQKKACPHCGQRLDTCDQTPRLRINPIRMSTTCEYYCPVCCARFSIDGNYAEYIPRERDIPQAQGEEFRVRPGVLALTMLFWLAMGLIGAVFLISAIRGIINIYAGGLSGGLMASTLVIMVTLGLVFLGLSFMIFKAWNRSRQAVFRLLNDGLVNFDGITARYFMWEDFRVAQYLTKAYMGMDIYAFDTKEHQFALVPELKNYKRLGEAILAKLRATDCRILDE